MTSNSIDLSFGGSADRGLADLWDAILTLQVEFCLPQEWPAYYLSLPWARARDVLDAGAGNGFYLRQLKSRFPNKRYTAADNFGALLGRALGDDSDVCRVAEDVRNLSGNFDFVIARLLFQHVNEPFGVLDKLRQLVRIGGSLLVIDAHDDDRLFDPDIPMLREFFALYAEEQKARGFSRSIVSELLKNVVEERTEWHLGLAANVVIPSTVGRNLALFRQYYPLAVDLLEYAGVMSFDFSKLRDVLRAWCEGDMAYAQVGLSILRLDRVA